MLVQIEALERYATIIQIVLPPFLYDPIFLEGPSKSDILDWLKRQTGVLKGISGG